MNRKYATDAVWVSGSFGIQAVCGALINFAILYFLNSAALGVFNQIYAIYVITGQLAVFGIHDSALKHVAEVPGSKAQHSPGTDRPLPDLAGNAVCAAAVACATGLGLVGALLLAALSGPLGGALASPQVQTGCLYLAPGIFFFVINKVMIYMLNGQQRMSLFAIASAARAAVIVVLVLAIIFYFPAHEHFGLAFTLAEMAVFLLVLSWKPFSLSVAPQLFRYWLRRHLQFGARSFAHSMVAEAFIRVDVLVLGLYMSDRAVGIYSFAAFFAEGIYQVPVIVRNMNNPILVRLLAEGPGREFVNFTRRTGALSVAMTIVVAGSVAAIYPWLDLVFDAETIRQSTPIIWILAAGMVGYALFVPFDFLFMTAGRPGTQSWFMLGNMTVNILLNLLLIPHFGLIGACSATVASFAFAGGMLNVLGRSILRLPRGLYFE